MNCEDSAGQSEQSIGRIPPLMDLPTRAAADSESRLSYPGWKIVLAGFFGVMVSFAALVPSTFSLFSQTALLRLRLASRGDFSWL